MTSARPEKELRQYPQPDDKLGKFRSITLGEADCVSLMNRIETKYVFMSAKLNDIFSLLPDDYHVLEIENRRSLPYHTTYFDTSVGLFYYQHLHGKLNRYKIRYRRYVTTDESFLEIKKKTNTGRTIKKRIENRFQDDRFDQDAMGFIDDCSPVHPCELSPVLLNRFCRITFANFKQRERITLDLNISFSDPSESSEVGLPYLAIAELKKEVSSGYSPFRQIAKQLRIYPIGFSKYCFGSAVMNRSLKRNLLKPKILLLNKFENEYTRFAVTV